MLPPIHTRAYTGTYINIYFKILENRTRQHTCCLLSTHIHTWASTMIEYQVTMKKAMPKTNHKYLNHPTTQVNHTWRMQYNVISEEGSANKLLCLARHTWCSQENWREICCESCHTVTCKVLPHLPTIFLLSGDMISTIIIVSVRSINLIVWVCYRPGFGMYMLINPHIIVIIIKTAAVNCRWKQKCVCACLRLRVCAHACMG